jgi:hypothetical protein
MYDGIDEEEFKAAQAGFDQEELNGILTGTEGFVKFLIYSNFFNEGCSKLNKILETTDLEDELTSMVFKKVTSDIFEKSFELVYSHLENPHIQGVLSEAMNWDSEFILAAEKAYNESEKPLANDERERKFFEHRLITDILGQNFNNKHLKTFMFNEEVDDPFLKTLKNKVQETLEEKFETDFNQFLFLSYMTQISSTEDRKVKKELFKDLKRINGLNKRFFSDTQKQILKEVLKFSM